jgi:hypothetical protein
MSTVRTQRFLPALALAAALTSVGCKKEAPVAAPAAAPAAAAAAPASGGLPRAKALVDQMTGEIAKHIEQVEAAGTDQVRIRAIGEDLKRSLEGSRGEGEELVKKLSETEKKELDAYAKEKIQPIYGKLMSVMMKVQLASRDMPGSPTPTAVQAEAGQPPVAAMPAAPTPPIAP